MRRVALLVAILCVTGCQFGNTVMVSKGEVGGFSELIGGEADYCKWTTTNEAPMSAEAQEAFISYCEATE